VTRAEFISRTYDKSDLTFSGYPARFIRKAIFQSLVERVRRRSVRSRNRRSLARTHGRSNTDRSSLFGTFFTAAAICRQMSSST
jgi:hypothetical protein